MILADSMFVMQNSSSNDTFTDWASAYNSRSAPADSFVIAGIFCTVFSIMCLLLILLLCKVWSLRRAVAPVTLQLDLQAEAESESGQAKRNHLTQQYV